MRTLPNVKDPIYFTEPLENLVLGDPEVKEETLRFTLFFAVPRRDCEDELISLFRVPGWRVTQGFLNPPSRPAPGAGKKSGFYIHSVLITDNELRHLFERALTANWAEKYPEVRFPVQTNDRKWVN